MTCIPRGRTFEEFTVGETFTTARTVTEGAVDRFAGLFTSFGYFEAREDDLLVLRNVRVSLKGHGALVMDALTAGRGRVARPEEIAGVHAFLASEDAAFITGQVLFVDGGMSVGV